MKKSTLLLLSFVLSCTAIAQQSAYILPPEAQPIPAATLTSRLDALQRNNNDDEAFYQLSFSSKSIDLSISKLTPEQQKKLPELIEYRNILNMRSRFTTDPGRKFVLRMRDFIRTEMMPQERLKELRKWLWESDKHSWAQLEMLRRAMMYYAGYTGRVMADARITWNFIRNYSGGGPVRLSLEQERKLTELLGHSHSTFVHSEKALSGGIATATSQGRERLHNLLASLIWQNPHAALALARGKGLYGYELLAMEPGSTPAFLSSKGILHYREYGHDAPESCLTALQFPAADVNTLRQQNARLPEELRALAPRCMLALGNNAAEWEPVHLSSQDISRWPDASAVTLPGWKPELVGLADEDTRTVMAAFDGDMGMLARLLDGVQQHHGTSALLAKALQECNDVRPLPSDGSIPVFVRLALSLEADGLTLDFEPDSGFDFPSSESQFPILAEACRNIPRLLHRITLELALLEKHDRHAELEKSCTALARLLNRHSLWPLIICQRELRGFSPRALLTLFRHYEGEKAPLRRYGEAMGMESEMTVAALASEDDAGDNLMHAARISGALPSEEHQRSESAEALLSLAHKHAQDEDPGICGSIISLLLRSGMAEPLLARENWPIRFFCGTYSANGLRLIEALIATGRRAEAEKLLATMAEQDYTRATPAWRLAAALLATSPEEAARLRRDALLLTMLWRTCDETIYTEGLELLASTPEGAENAVRLSLICTQGRSAGITPAMAEMFLRHGLHRKAAFVYEYLLCEGVSTATPYGAIPNQADIARYRTLAQECLQQTGAPAKEQNRQNEAAPVTPYLFTASAPCEWRLKNGSSVKGRLVGVYEQPEALCIQAEDGSSCLLLQKELTESPAQRIDSWKKENGICLWEWKRAPYRLANFDKEWGFPLYAYPDFGKPGHHILVVQRPDNSISHLRTFGLVGKQAELASDFCKKNAQQSQQLHLATTPAQAMQMAAGTQLPVLVLFFTENSIDPMPSSVANPAQSLYLYLAAHPEAPSIWRDKFILLPVVREQIGSSFGFSAAVRQELLQLEQQYRPDTTAHESQLLRKLDSLSGNSILSGLHGCLISPQETKTGILELAPASVLPQDFPVLSDK